MALKLKAKNPAPSPSVGEGVREVFVGGKRILVIDGLFDGASIEKVFNFLKSCPYRWINTDNLKDSHSVRWKADLPTSIQDQPFFSEIVRKSNDAFGTPDTVLHRVYANMNHYGEIHFEHIDELEGFSALYYANPEWDPSWQGETLFFADNGEALTAVSPKPGRLLIFDASIIHRGSPPSRECFAPRITLAFKFVPRENARERAKKRPKRVS
ncbi:MAG TPA: 2OG-Fe(II) oxygenase [Bdellovibrionota bacterium]|nr:2OG-Fe(II) oxygenase [Bdellovibrionota bacterium]